MENYPHLRLLLDGYFHQDFTIHGETLEEIIALYRKEGSEADAVGLRTDIHNFLKQYDDAHIKEAFESTFRPDVAPEGFGLSIREWLLRIDTLLQ